jgi:hypothetical protein
MKRLNISTGALLLGLASLIVVTVPLKAEDESAGVASPNIGSGVEVLSQSYTTVGRSNPNNPNSALMAITLDQGAATDGASSAAAHGAGYQDNINNSGNATGGNYASPYMLMQPPIE